MDEFIDIIGYEGLYKINKKGEVYGVKRKNILSKCFDSDSYYIVTLSKNGKRLTHKIHRLVALHFIHNNNETKNIVDHIDGVKTNNNIENLRWVTITENSRNQLSKTNYICDFFRKDRGYIIYIGFYPVYINGKYTKKQKNSKNRNVVEEWIEQMKKEYPNEYIAGRI